jgi:hypothetical protein
MNPQAPSCRGHAKDGREALLARKAVSGRTER